MPLSLTSVFRGNPIWFSRLYSIPESEDTSFANAVVPPVIFETCLQFHDPFPEGSK